MASPVSFNPHHGPMEQVQGHPRCADEKAEAEADT